MNKTTIKLAVIVPAVVGALVLSSVLILNVVRQVIIEDNEVLAHSVAQSILPALLADDTKQVEALLKALESQPGVQSAELISAQGASIASYSRSGLSMDPTVTSFELAAAEEDVNPLHVMAPLTFDSLIVANLHIAVNLWPTYLRVMTWFGLLLIVPSVLYLLIKQSRVKLRFETVGKSGEFGGGDTFDIDKVVNTAMDGADISVEFQPIQRMSDSGLFGMEVLVCWRHPSGQTLHVVPSDFFALTQSNKISLPFDDWLLTTACKQAAAWQHQYGPLILSISISASQFMDPLFAQKIRAICEQTQYPHQLLELEVHAAALARNSQLAIRNLETFAAHGLSVTINNYGLINISLALFDLAYVKKIKLDRKLVNRVGRDEHVLDFVNGIVAHALQHEVQIIVPGVELKQQRDALQRIGCHFGQGTYFYPPLASKNFEAFLKGRPFDGSGSGLSKEINAQGSSDARFFSAV